MNKNKVKELIRGLKEAPESIKNTIGTVTTHGELIRLVASDLPELQKSFDKARKMGGWKKAAEGGTYHFGHSHKLYTNPTVDDEHWLDALAVYLDKELGEDSDTDAIYDSLNAWTENPEARYEAVVAHWFSILNKKEKWNE